MSDDNKSRLFHKFFFRFYRIYCTWRDGSKIGAFSAVVAETPTIDCKCARDKMIYSITGLEHSLSCNFGGSYRNLQEDNGQFYCVDRDGFAVSPPSTTTVECDQYYWYVE